MTLLQALRLPQPPAWFAAMFLGRPIARRATFADVPGPVISRRGIVLPLALLGEDGAEAAAAPRFRAGKVIDLHLPADALLRRMVEIPVSALARRRRVAELDLLRRTPFAAGEVAWTLGPPRREGAAARLDQWIVRREDVSGLAARVAALGFRVRDVLAEPAPEAGPLLTLGAGEGSRRLRRLNAVLVIAALLAAGASLALPTLRDLEARAGLERRVEELRAAAVEARRGLAEAEAIAGERGAFVERIAGRATLLETLRAVTVALPDDTWLSDLSLDGAGVAIAGETSGSAAELLLSLKRGGALGSARLSGPVSRTASGAERFTMEAAR